MKGGAARRERGTPTHDAGTGNAETTHTGTNRMYAQKPHKRSSAYRVVAAENQRQQELHLRLRPQTRTSGSETQRRGRKLGIRNNPSKQEARGCEQKERRRTGDRTDAQRGATRTPRRESRPRTHVRHGLVEELVDELDALLANRAHHERNARELA